MTLKKPLKGTYDILNAINDNFRESNSLRKLIKKIISFLAQKKEEGLLSNILIWERLIWSIPPKGFKRFFLLWKKKKEWWRNWVGGGGEEDVVAILVLILCLILLCGDTENKNNVHFYQASHVQILWTRRFSFHNLCCNDVVGLQGFWPLKG